jgi:hypothetical protein
MRLRDSDHARRVVRVIIIAFVAASVAVAQDSEAVLTAIERRSQPRLPKWGVDLRDVQSSRAGTIRWRRLSRPRRSDDYVFVGLLILNDAEEARHHFNEMVSENIQLFQRDKSIFAKTKIAGVADENCLFTFSHGNPSVILRKGKYFVTVDGTSLRAVKTFTRLVANQLP